MTRKVTEVYAWIADNPGEDEEGIVAALMGNAWTPLVCTTQARAMMLKPSAQQIAKLGNKTIRLVRFTMLGDVAVDVVEP